MRMLKTIMKLLFSTRCLLNYQWWCEAVENLLQIVSQFQVHKRPNQFRQAKKQVLECAGIAKEWRDKWILN